MPRLLSWPASLGCRSRWLAVALIVLGGPASAQLPVYTDSLQSGFTDWSWGTRDLAQTTVVHGGAAAISFEPDAWAGLFLHRDAGFTGAEYSAIELWVRGAGSGGQQVTVAVLSGGDPVGSAPLAGFVEGGTIPAGSWAKATVPFSSLGLPASGSWDGLWLQDASGGNQATLYVDDVRLLPNDAPPPSGGPVTVSVDPALDRRAVSPHIFGVNFGSAAQAQRLRWPARRWGGNSVTRYNWQNDTSNKGMDWFFMNVPEDNPDPSTLPSGSAADRFLDETRAAGGEPILTVPLIGWTPKARQKDWGFSIAKYGAQTNTECLETGGAFWCQPDAGNGILAGGAFVTGNDPLDTSIAIGPSFVTAWMDHLAARYGAAGSGGIRWYALDNEPALWNSTHRDVHPEPLTYDELWTRTRDVAAAIKAKDPAAVVFGPVSWGWCEYFYSAADDCSPNGADHVAHGRVPLTQWYLRQVRQYEEQHGVRLVDVLDVHYYPQAAGVALSNDESAATSARRLRSLRSLWDPTYVDESWIPDAVRLIPRMKEWIAAELPGTKLAITEYSWGNDDGISSALAQVEVLGIFAREGVDVATRWVAPAAGSRVEDAFRLWMNYDDAGAGVTGASVRAASSAPNAVSGYAVEAAGGLLRVVLVNRDTVQRPVTVALASGGARNVRVFGFDGATRLAALGGTAFASGQLTLDLPARSARLLEVAPDGGTASIGTPAITSPTAGQVLGVAGVNLSWNAVTNATGYDLRLLSSTSGATVFSGSLAGNGSTSTLLTLPNGSYQMAVRACRNGLYTDPSCGAFATRAFSVSLIAPTGAPTITAPSQGATLTTSTQTFSWTSVPKADPGLSLSYEVLLVDVAAGNVPQLQISVPDPTLSTIFTLHSSAQYQLRVRACQSGCGPWSVPVTFAVDLPAVPTSAPTIGSCNVTGGNSLTCTWSAVSGADAYQVQVVQPPPAGPGGGALTVAARQVSTTSVTFPVPAGGATVFLSACNGDGCGPNATRDISVPGPNPPQPNLGPPMAGTVVAGPSVIFAWNRVPGDTGSNTLYRLYVQDLSRQAAALDVYTRDNYFAAYFKAEGARYDALVISNPGLPGQVVGPAQGFNVSGSSATAPTMVAPAHNGTATAGNVALGWSPVPGATLYEYYVGVLGATAPTARGVTPGLVAYVPLAGASGGILYSGIVRACPEGATCLAGSDAGWGPWSNAPGGPGVTNFTVTP